MLAERFPHFGIPGFEKLPPETQELYLKIPASHLDASRPIIEKEIAKATETTEKKDRGETKKSEGRTEETTASNREVQSETAIETFHRAEAGDPNAKKDLLDQKRELLGEEPSDDEIFQTLLEDQSGLFDNSLVLEVALSDSETQQHQDVLDLYKEFRGDLASVDEAIKPQQQIDLFIELTKGGGTLARGIGDDEIDACAGHGLHDFQAVVLNDAVEKWDDAVARCCRVRGRKSLRRS